MNVFTYGFKTASDILKVPGYIPFIGTLTAPYRFALGKIEIIAGIGLTVICGLAAIFAELMGKTSLCLSLEKKAFLALDYIAQGVLEIARSFVESIPFVNLGCLVYDLSRRNIHPYQFETPEVLLIFPYNPYSSHNPYYS